MTNLETIIKKVLELSEKATPGEWAAGPNFGIFSKVETRWGDGETAPPEIVFSGLISAVRPYEVDNASLIAHYRTSAPKLAKICEILFQCLKDSECYCYYPDFKSDEIKCNICRTILEVERILNAN